MTGYQSRPRSVVTYTIVRGTDSSIDVVADDAVPAVEDRLTGEHSTVPALWRRHHTPRDPGPAGVLGLK